MSQATDEKAIKARITKLKTRDALTGLYSRGHFLALLESALSKPAKGEARGLVYLRPDNFGEIDERFGPSGSDSLLKQLGAIFKDSMAKRCLVSRFGGNVFVALVVRENAEEVNSLAESLLTSVSYHMFEVDTLSTAMTLSVGTVILSSQTTSADEAVSLAQVACRQARREGGNTLHFDEPSDDAYREEVEYAQWAKRINAALENDGFRLAYQPIASLDGSTNFSYDVLLRMLGEEGEDVLPGEFMPAAEAAGLMPAIDRWVIRSAFTAAAKRHAAGKKTRIFVRLAESTLRDKTFFNWLGLEALSHRLDRESVVFHLTEQVSERCLPIVRELGSTCVDLHLKLSLANSGVGGRCLQLVQDLTLDFLELDGEFIKESDPDDLDALLELAREKQLEVIATRVESAADLARLYSLGVDSVIGFHVQEPEQEITEGINLPESANA